MQVHRLRDGEDPLHVLKRLMAQFRFVAVPDLPRFCGGFVGYLGYDLVRFFERLPDQTGDDLQLPDCYLMLAGTVVIFDHLKRRMRILLNAFVDDDPEKAYETAMEHLHDIVQRLRMFPIPFPYRSSFPAPRREVVSNFTREGFEEVVERAKEYIAAGDIIQVVLSQRFQTKVNAPAF